MNKFVTIIISIVIVGVMLVSCARGCSEQSIAKEWGGTTNIALEPNQKLVEVTWKDTNLWYLTRPMRQDEEAETYTFKEQDVWGILEGSVIITERKMTEEEYQEWYATKYLEEDYYREGNLQYTDNGTVEIYITYDVETGVYKKIKPYIVTEEGSLVPAQ